jgi:arylsulfatase A-like enzyme
MGNRAIRTVNIDRLADKGFLFTNAFCTTSICAISRASFFTGQFERRHGIRDFQRGLSTKQFAQTFPYLLHQAGYRTGFVGKWGVGGVDWPRAAYDYWAGYPGQGNYFEPGNSEHLTRRLARQALEFLNGCTPEQPFCLQISFKAPHCQDGAARQFPPDPQHRQLYEGITIPVSPTADERHFQLLPDALRSSEARRRWNLRFATPEMFQDTVKDYYRLITGVDEVIGELRARLRERRLDDNTVILFTADNGFYLGEHGLAGKWFMHEESIRLPLILFDPRTPGAVRGRRIPQFVLNIDMAPTILDLAEVPIPPQIQGKSVLPLLGGDETPWRSDFFYEHRFVHKAIPQSEGVRTARWKYVRYYSQKPVYEELYDLEQDPFEEQNRAANPAYSAQLVQLRHLCDKMAKEAE